MYTFMKTKQNKLENVYCNDEDVSLMNYPLDRLQYNRLYFHCLLFFSDNNSDIMLKMYMIYIFSVIEFNKTTL